MINLKNIVSLCLLFNLFGLFSLTCGGGVIQVKPEYKNQLEYQNVLSAIQQPSTESSGYLSDRTYFKIVTPTNTAPVAINITTGSYVTVIDWGDGNSTVCDTTRNYTNTYANSNTVYQMTVRGGCTRFYFYNQTGSDALKEVLTDINGMTNLTSASSAFRVVGLSGKFPGWNNCPLITDFSAVAHSTAFTNADVDSMSNCLRVTSYVDAFRAATIMYRVPRIYSPLVSSVQSMFRSSIFSAGSSIDMDYFSSCTGVNIAMDTVFYSSDVTNAISFSANTNATTFLNAYGLCTSLKWLPDNMFSNCSKVTTFASTFNGCSALTSSVPIFAGCTSVTTFASCFNNCYNLSYLTPNAFADCSKVTTFDRTFVHCGKMTNSDVNTFSSITNTATLFSYTMHGCSNITVTPSFSSNFGAKTFFETLYECTSLTNAPLFSSCTNANSFASTMYGCTNLKWLPDNMFSNCSKVTTFASAFQGCTALTNVPETTFYGCTGTTSYASSFKNTTSLRSIPSNIFWYSPAVASFSSTFYQSGIDGVDVDLLKSNSLVTSVSFMFYNVPNLTNYPTLVYSPKIFSFASFNQNGAAKIKYMPWDMLTNNTAAASASFDCGVAFANHVVVTGRIPVLYGLTNCRSFTQMFQNSTNAGFTNTVADIFGSVNYTNLNDCRNMFLNVRGLTGNGSDFTNKWPSGLKDNFSVANNSSASSYRMFSGCTNLSDYFTTLHTNWGGTYYDASLSNVMGYWAMENNWFDSGNSNNYGTASGAIFTNDARVGRYAGSFNGTTAFVQTTNRLSCTSEFSMVTWLKEDQAYNQPTIMVPIGLGVTYGMRVGGTFGSSGYKRQSISLMNGANNASSTPEDSYNQFDNYGIWRHVVITYSKDESTRIHIYMDGIAMPVVTTNFSGSITNPPKVRLGQRADVAYTFFGSMDETYVYDRALSSTEITNLYLSVSGTSSIDLMEYSSDSIIQSNYYDRSGNEFLPAMTDSNAPANYVVSQGAQFNATYTGWKSFDKVLGTFWHSGSGPRWVSIDLGAGNEKTVIGYSIKSVRVSSETAKDATFRGSTDGISYTFIQSFTNFGDYVTAIPTIFPVTNTTAYRFYRWDITETCIGKVNMFELASGRTYISQAQSESTIKSQGDYSLRLNIPTNNPASVFKSCPTPLVLLNRTNVCFDLYSQTIGSDIVRFDIVNYSLNYATNSFYPNIVSSNEWVTYNWDISAIPDNQRNAILWYGWTITNQVATNVVYIDNVLCR